MAELKFVSGFVSTYRYGFNGKEKDDEVSGGGNDYDYGARIYNPRLGRFLSIDPLASDYPFYSPYLFAGNKPIMAVDIDGLEADKNPNVVEVPLEGINKRIDLKVVSTSSGLTGMEKFKAFGIGVLKGVTAAVVVVAVAAAVVATCGVAGVVLVEAAAVVGATYMAKEATEVITGKSLFTGQKLTQGQRYDKAGQIAGGLIVGGVANKISSGVTKLISGLTRPPVTPELTPCEETPPVQEEGKLHQPGDFADEDIVVRGGLNAPKSFESGSGVTTDANGNLEGISVNCQSGADIIKLTETIPHGKVGVTTAGDIRKAGGSIVPSPNERNLTHATMGGVNSEKASSLMNVQPNPSK
jgi:RHS repeat-associated protein